MTLEDPYAQKEAKKDSSDDRIVNIDVRNVTLAEMKEIMRTVMDSEVLKDFVRQYQALLSQKDLGSEESERYEVIKKYLKRRINFIDKPTNKRTDDKFHLRFKEKLNV